PVIVLCLGWGCPHRAYKNQRCNRHSEKRVPNTRLCTVRSRQDGLHCYAHFSSRSIPTLTGDMDEFIPADWWESNSLRGPTGGSTALFPSHSLFHALCWNAGI